MGRLFNARSVWGCAVFFIYRLLCHMMPTYPPGINIRRVVLIQPCCIGDVVLATAALSGLRRAYPRARITFAVGSWSLPAVAGHPHYDQLMDLGPGALPLRSPGSFRRFIELLRTGDFDLAVSLVRSPLMSAALAFSGIPHRVGLDSGGRGFGYTVRVPLDPAAVRHEAEIYLDTLRALGHSTEGCRAYVPVQQRARETVRHLLERRGIDGPFIVINPAGGENPGMHMPAKRWPQQHFAALAGALEAETGAQIILVAGPDDGPLLEAVAQRLPQRPQVFRGELSFTEIAALAADALLYVGNDTGLTHMAAAAGARTAMIMGPSDPARYAPFAPDSIVLWRPGAVVREGVAGGPPPGWNWERDGIGVDEALAELRRFLATPRPEVSPPGPAASGS